MTANYKFVANKKYMWDAKSYATEADARNAEARYKEHGFDVELFKEDGKHFLYTRRLPTIKTGEKSS